MSESRAGHLFDTWRRRRDPDALAEVFDLTAPRLLGLAIHLCGDAMEAEDLLQATFLAAMEHAGDYDASRPLLPWLSGILANEARLARRDAAREIDPARLVARTEATPLEEATQRELSGALAEALDRIEEPYRGVLVLRLRHGLAVGDIAHALGRSPGTVRVQLHRGLKQLRGMLPAGLIASMLLALSPTRGLAAVRAAVLESSVAGSLPWLGGLMMAKKLLLGSAVLAALTAAWWVLHRAGGSEPEASAVAAIDAGSAASQAEEVADSSRLGAAPIPERSPIESSATAELEPEEPAGALRVVARWSDGSPAASIGIDLHSGSEPKTAGYVASASTGSDGTTAFEGLPPGPYVAWFDRLSKAIQAEVRDGMREEIVATIPQGLEIDGLVVGPEQQPIAGAMIWISRKQPLWPNLCPSDSLPAAVTDSAGRFHLRSTGEAYFIGARAPGFAPSSRKHLRDLRGPGAEIVLTLPGAGGAVTGIVLASDGSPVMNARVQVDSAARFRNTTVGQSVNRIVFQSQPVETRSGADGRFRIDGIEPGRLELRVESPSGAPWRQKVDVAPGKTSDVLVRLVAPVTIVGRVVDPQGSPIGGITVFAPRTSRKEPVGEAPYWLENFAKTLEHGCENHEATTTQEDGSFELSGLPAGWLYAACTAEDRGRALAPVYAEAGTEVRVELCVDRGLELRLRCMDLEGRALANLSVYVFRAGEEQGATRGSKGGFRTDAEGRLVIPNCAPVDYFIDAREPVWGDRVAGPWPRVRPGPDEHVVRVDLPDVRPATVFGRVLDDLGQPLAGALFHPQLLGRGSGSVRTDNAGEFAAVDLRPGEYRFYVRAPGFPLEEAGRRTLAPGDEVDLGTVRLRTPAWLVVHLSREDGRPLDPPLMFRLIDIAADEIPVPTEMEVILGTAHLPPLPPGDYELRIEGPYLIESRQPVHLEAGATAHVDVLLRVGGWRVFVFELPPGAKAEEVRIQAFDERVIPVEDTRLTWDPYATTWGRTFEPGRYTIKAETNTGLYGWVEVLVDRTASDEAIRVVLK